MEAQTEPEELLTTTRAVGSASCCIAQRKYLIKITSFCDSL